MIIKPLKLHASDSIGVISPSRPICKLKEELGKSERYFRQLNHNIKFGDNIEKKLYYSAGTPIEKSSDLNRMFEDLTIKAIICATGGSSANQILDFINYKLIKFSPKIFLGYSDITILLNAIYSKTGLVTFYGPDFSSFFNLTTESKEFFNQLVAGEKLSYPKEIEVIKPGKARGRLVGGYLQAVSSLMSSGYAPNYNKKIFFWETSNISPAQIDFQLNQLKLSGIFKKISGMIVGHLSECDDMKYPEDSRSIKDIILQVTEDYQFPIIKVDYFGHDINNFYTIPIGVNAIINTNEKEFRLLESAVK